MGGVKVDGPDSPDIKSAEEMAGRFHGELIFVLPEWKQRLAGEPGQLEEVERDVHATFAAAATA